MRQFVYMCRAKGTDFTDKYFRNTHSHAKATELKEEHQKLKASFLSTFGAWYNRNEAEKKGGSMNLFVAPPPVAWKVVSPYVLVLASSDDVSNGLILDVFRKAIEGNFLVHSFDKHGREEKIVSDCCFISSCLFSAFLLIT